MSINNLKLTFGLSLVFCLIQPLSAIEKSHHNLSWLGFLHLPKEEVQIPKTIQLTEPRLWDEWRRNEETPITWFPKVTETKGMAPEGLIIRFDPPSTKHKTRRMKRNP